MLSGCLGLSPTVGVRPGGGGWYVGTYLPNVTEGMIKGLPSILTPQPMIRIMHLNLYKAPCQNASTNCLQLTNGLHSRKFFYNLFGTWNSSFP